MRQVNGIGISGKTVTVYFTDGTTRSLTFTLPKTGNKATIEAAAQNLLKQYPELWPVKIHIYSLNPLDFNIGCGENLRDDWWLR